MDQSVTRHGTSQSRLFTIKQTAVELNCSTRSVWRLLSERHLTGVRIGRTVRISRESIDAFIAKGGAR
jgi:excisionase family DNA binding protein